MPLVRKNAAPHPRSNRWDLVERYARYRGRMHLERLPCDVLRLIVTFLTQEEMLTLAEALVGRPVRWNMDPFPVPDFLRTVWRQAMGAVRLRLLIQNLSDDAFWYGSLFGKSHLHVDWSPFSRRPFQPIAYYLWSSERPHCRLTVNESEIYRCIERAAARGSSCVGVSLYIHSTHYRNGMQLRPVMSCHYDIVPPGTFRTDQRVFTPAGAGCRASERRTPRRYRRLDDVRLCLPQGCAAGPP